MKKTATSVLLPVLIICMTSCNGGGGGGSSSGGGIVDINPTAGATGGAATTGSVNGGLIGESDGGSDGGSNGRSDGGNGENNNSAPSTPSAPTELTRFSPSNDKGVDSTPEITVSGVTSGDTVQLFTDSSCDDLIGASVADGASVTITTDPLVVGNYNFYAQSSNSIGSSPCSSASVSYEYVVCPDGYINVPHNISVGTSSDFCVMVYEARYDEDNKPISHATGVPWENISALDAHKECLELGNGYGLISNAEWMTIARSIEATASNWINGFGTGQVVRGHSDSNPTRSCSSMPDQTHVGWNCASEVSNLNQLRTHTLENGEFLWDFSGNDWEWVDWNAVTEGFQLAPQTCTQTNSVELPLVSCPALTSNQYRPQNENLNSSNSVGKFVGGTGGAAARGGAWGTGSGAGIYALRLDFNDSTPNSGITFRCVYRP